MTDERERVVEIGAEALRHSLDDADVRETEAAMAYVLHQLTAAGYAIVKVEHDLYKQGDPDTPNIIKDRNGDVVLGLCRRCNKGEAELSEPCSNFAIVSAEDAARLTLIRSGSHVLVPDITVTDRIKALENLIPSPREAVMLERIREGTHCVMPKEPTEGMIRSAYRAHAQETWAGAKACWQAMVIAAAQEETQS